MSFVGANLGATTSSFDRLRMRSSERTRAPKGAHAIQEILILSLSKDEDFRQAGRS